MRNVLLIIYDFYRFNSTVNGSNNRCVDGLANGTLRPLSASIQHASFKYKTIK